MFLGLELSLGISFSCVRQRGCKPYEWPQLLRKHQQVMSHVGIKGGSVNWVFLFVGSCKRIWKVSKKNGLWQHVDWAGTYTWFIWSCVQLKAVLSLLNGYNILRKQLHVTDFVIISHTWVGKNLSPLAIYECDAWPWYFSLGSGKLDPGDGRKTHSGSILAFK
jgi:hypothetical protein